LEQFPTVLATKTAASLPRTGTAIKLLLFNHTLLFVFSSAKIKKIRMFLQIPRFFLSSQCKQSSYSCSALVCDRRTASFKICCFLMILTGSSGYWKQNKKHQHQSLKSCWSCRKTDFAVLLGLRPTA